MSSRIPVSIMSSLPWSSRADEMRGRWLPKDLPGGHSTQDQEVSHRPQGLVLGTRGSVSPLSPHEAFFSLLALVLWCSLAHVCIFTFYSVMLLDELTGFHESSRTISFCHQMAAQYHSRVERGGGDGFKDFGYVPLTKPSPEIRHHFLRIFSTDTLKIKSSIAMFCLSIAMQQNNSTQPTGIKG